MATKRERLKTLKQWAEYFPEFTLWEDQWLLKQNGIIISGICLNRRSEKSKYEAVYVMDIISEPVFHISLNYNRRLGRYNGAIKTLYYNNFNPEDIQEFKRQLPLIEKDITFNDFFTFIEDVYDYDRLGTTSIPSLHNVLKDIATAGAYCGDKNFYLDQLSLAKRLLDNYYRDSQILNPVDTDKWINQTEELLNTDFEMNIKKALQKEGLGDMKDHGIKQHKCIKNYLQRLKKAVYSFYPDLRKLSKKL